MANFNYNLVVLGGRLTADPELKTTPTGIPVTTFPIAVNRNYKDESGKAAADFINIVAWRKEAEFVTKFFRKGSSICVTGSLMTRTWVDKQGQKRFTIEVQADDIKFVDAKSEMPRSFSDVVVTEDSPAMAGVSEAAAAGQQAYMTPGARGEIREAMAEGDGELPF